MKSSIILSVIALLSTLEVSAQDAVAPDLLNGCRSIVILIESGTDLGNQIDEAFCLGYVNAVRDSIQFTREIDSSSLNICVPSSVAAGQMIQVFVKYLKDNPQNLHFPNYSLVLLALGTAFPCTTPDGE